MKWFLAVLFLFSALHAEVSVKVDRDTVKLNESIHITFVSDQKIKKQPDFSPLEKDFEILSQSQNSSTRMINGTTNHEISWSLTLMSKKKGDITIPSLNFGSQQSKPVIIHVDDAALSKQGDPLFFEVELSPSQQVYEQSQLIYTLRFYRSVNLYSGRLSDIQVSDPDAIIEKIGEDKEYDVINDGTRYLVLERKYAVFPQHPDELTFSPITFEGQIVTGGRSMFNMHTQYKRLSSQPAIIDVKPIPPPFTRQNWLAAEDVKLVDEWSGDIAQITVGEPITRTVTIMADGCLSSQIPSFDLNLPGDVKQYPDKPQTFNQNLGNGFTGIKQTKTALIASKPGTLTLPEISVKWWDVNANLARESTLPEMTLHIVDAPPTEATTTEVIEQVPSTLPQPVPLWAWVLIGLNGVWIIGLPLVLIQKRKPSQKKPTKNPTLSKIKQSLKNACLANNAKETHKHLLEWAKITFPHLKPLNLSTLKTCVSEELQEEISDLNEALYSPNALWTGQDFWQAFSTFKPSDAKEGKQSSSALKNLYE